MNTDQFGLVNYLIGTVPCYGFIAICYFVVVLLGSRASDPVSWRTNLWVAVALAFFNAISLSDQYRYLNLPKLPLPPTPGLSTMEGFFLMAAGLFVVLTVTNILGNLVVAAARPEKGKGGTAKRGGLVSMSVLAGEDEAVDLPPWEASKRGRSRRR